MRSYVNMSLGEVVEFHHIRSMPLSRTKGLLVLKVTLVFQLAFYMSLRPTSVFRFERRVVSEGRVAKSEDVDTPLA